MRTSPPAIPHRAPIRFAPAGIQSGQVDHKRVDSQGVYVDLASPPTIASPASIGASSAGTQLFSTGHGTHCDTQMQIAGGEQAALRSSHSPTPNADASAGSNLPVGHSPYDTRLKTAGGNQAENGESS